MCEITTNLKEVIKNLKYILLDMDGTIYFDTTPIGNMKETLNALRALGKKLIFVTNNSSKSLKTYEEKLKNMGLFSEQDEVFSSGLATAMYLEKNCKDKTCYLFGTNSLKQEFLAHNVKLVENNADIAVLAYNTEMTYKDVVTFSNNLITGAKYISTHPDTVCPALPYSVPDNGSFIEMFKTATGRTPELIVGKPNSFMGEILIKQKGANKNEFLMVGDRLYTDIAFGVNSGFYSMLVLSGETTVSDLQKTTVNPTFVLKDLNEILKYID